MKKIILKVALLACAAIAGNVHAVGVSGQGTWETTLLGRDITGKAVAGSDASAVFLYDTTLKITWLRDANYAQTTGVSSNGVLNWSQAKTWASNLNIGGYSGWRLPTMISNPNDTFGTTGTDSGYNVRTTSGSTVYSEMASLWYDTLGNKALYNTAGANEPSWGA